MARKPMVSRSFTTTKVSALGLDTAKGEPMNVTVVLPRTFKDDTKLLKAVQSQADTDTYKVVSIVSKVEETKLYGMAEEEFLKYAKELDEKTRKEIATEDVPVEVQ